MLEDMEVFPHEGQLIKLEWIKNIKRFLGHIDFGITVINAFSGGVKDCDFQKKSIKKFYTSWHPGIWNLSIHWVTVAIRKSLPSNGKGSKLVILIYSLLSVVCPYSLASPWVDLRPSIVMMKDTLTDCRTWRPKSESTFNPSLIMQMGIFIHFLQCNNTHVMLWYRHSDASVVWQCCWNRPAGSIKKELQSSRESLRATKRGGLV